MPRSITETSREQKHLGPYLFPMIGPFNKKCKTVAGYRRSGCSGEVTPFFMQVNILWNSFVLII